MIIYLFLDIHKKKHKVYWSDTHLSFNDTPYMVINQKLFDCQHGKDFFFQKNIKKQKNL